MSGLPSAHPNPNKSDPLSSRSGRRGGQSIPLIYFIAILTSFILSYSAALRATVINPDAICYLYSAALLAKASLYSAMHLCPQAAWPFYSILIFTVTSLTHLTYTASAFLLNGFFSAISVAMFIAIVDELGGSVPTMWFAAITILLAHTFNILRLEIIRDHGFWCGYLVSLFFMLRFFRCCIEGEAACHRDDMCHPAHAFSVGPSAFTQPIALKRHWVPRFTLRGMTLFYAFLASMSLLIATLFRIEGVAFLLLLPLIAWMMPMVAWRSRFQAFILLNVPLIVLLLGLILYWLLSATHTLQSFGRVAEIFHHLSHGLSLLMQGYRTMANAIHDYVLPQAGARDTDLMTWLLLIIAYVFNVVDNLSFVYAGCILYAWINKIAHFSVMQSRVMIGYILVNIVVTFIFFVEHQFLARRYLIALSLVLMLWVPFALQSICAWGSVKRRVLTMCILGFIVLTSLGGLFHFGHSKIYIREAGDWLAHTVPSTARLYTNDYQLMYYSQHFKEGIFKQWDAYHDLTTTLATDVKQYDYLALLINREERVSKMQMLQSVAMLPIKVFEDGRGDGVYIYRVGQERKQ